ncbi:hypothetical protein PGTUg99_026853 [Puccinia graminis f. sp. tritici]|uniref:Uncharacterized protein n=1 Tax=Puccinia graminis f. sp. tritici TaxID=56615 RepID=A0A5B0RU04_PUCGR|nr:hypothetical protein PGTUg99_026853 [Puccinia graminis f. sp. tritici]
MLIGSTQRILTALAKGWVELIAEAPEATGNQPSAVGFTDNVTSGDATSVVVGRAKNQSKAKSKKQTTTEKNKKRKAPALTSKKTSNKINQSRKKRRISESVGIRGEGDWDSSDDEEDEDFEYDGGDTTEEDDSEDQTDDEGESGNSVHE